MGYRYNEVQLNNEKERRMNGSQTGAGLEHFVQKRKPITAHHILYILYTRLYELSTMQTGDTLGVLWGQKQGRISRDC